eukprot:5858656-Karenia_brevis.AAC.1
MNADIFDGVHNVAVESAHNTIRVQVSSKLSSKSIWDEVRSPLVPKKLPLPNMHFVHNHVAPV